MSSPDEVSVRGSSFGPESGEHSEGRRFGRGCLRGPSLGPDKRLLRSSQNKLSPPVSKPFHYDSLLDGDEMEGRSVIWGCEGRPGTPVDERGDSLDFEPQLTVEGTRIGQDVGNWEAWSIHGYQSPKSCTAEYFGIRGDSDTGTNRRGIQPPISVEGKQFSGSQLQFRGLGRSRGGVTPRRGATNKIMTNEDYEYPCSDPESSDDISEIQMMRVMWDKEGSRPGHPGASGASAGVPAPVASGGLHKTSPRKKTAQEKQFQWDDSRGPLGRTFPPWGQRLKSAPVEPASFPPITGVALLGKTSKGSMPSSTKEYKPFCTGKKSTARRTKESQPGVKEDNELTRDPGLQAQLPTHRVEQPFLYMNRGEMPSGDASSRAPQVSGNIQLQRSARPRARTPTGDQEPSPRLPYSVGERQNQAPGTVGCQQCLMFQKEIEELKEQLAIKETLIGKFQHL